MADALYPRAVAPEKRAAGKAGAAPERLDSLDAFRGLVILTMTFVNYLAGIKGIPAWAKHMPDKQDGYTFVDLVFPGFLFAAGVAIPFAFKKRMDRGESLLALVARVVWRSAALIFVGVIMVNAEETFSEKATPMSPDLWFLLAMLGVIGLWSRFPNEKAAGRQKYFFALRVVSALVLAYLLVIFRSKSSGGGVGWLQHSWWGIVGLIGWAYLTCSLAYLAFRGSSVALMGALGFMIAVYIGDKHGVLDWLGPLGSFVSIGELLGTTSGSVMIGVLVGNALLGASRTVGGRVRFMLCFGTGLYLAGILIRPLHGIIKNDTTDAYTLVAGGICCLVFLVVYLVLDVLKFRPLAVVFGPVGQNALLAYMLPAVLENAFNLMGKGDLLFPYSSGVTGAINCAVLAVGVAIITWIATKRGMRLTL
jgi:heparan-alpha-glucosaminide N-acetyltransferase